MLSVAENCLRPESASLKEQLQPKVPNYTIEKEMADLNKDISFIHP